MSKTLLRQIKSIDYLLELPLSQSLSQKSSREFVRECLRDLLDNLRQRILASQLPENTELDALIESELPIYWQKNLYSNLQPIINATGTLLHTNLGRAPLAPQALEAINKVAKGYSNLEYNLAKGARGSRDEHSEELLKVLLGCEAAVIVNNNAAAVMLVLDELAQDGEAIISRGELIEIGGAFRIPDVMKKSGATLREVGTTNRTRLSDYESAINENTKIILRVHPSNYRIIGFTEKPSLIDLVKLAKKYNLILVEDLGSGCLVDLRDCGIKDEPTAQASILAGVDVVTFSGDKMLGGPQAGIIAGKKAYLARIRRNPLMRALRVDKLSYAALSETLKLYRIGKAWQQIPILRALQATEKDLLLRSQNFLRRLKRRLPKDHSLKLSMRGGSSVIGGGSAPETPLPTTLIVIENSKMSANEMEIRLRKNILPIIARIEENNLIIDLRSVLDDDEEPLLKAIMALALVTFPSV
ncbi:MAG: L-seryl-tRNA(Sec) selenium transferase [Acidobacteria bacterium]|nr:L-seryl-tRNA(Sec) selenium transferase [Acidobacteriota bacterium]